MGTRWHNRQPHWVGLFCCADLFLPLVMLRSLFPQVPSLAQASWRSASGVYLLIMKVCLFSHSTHIYWVGLIAQNPHSPKKISGSENKAVVLSAIPQYVSFECELILVVFDVFIPLWMYMLLSHWLLLSYKLWPYMHICCFRFLLMNASLHWQLSLELKYLIVLHFMAIFRVASFDASRHFAILVFISH